jgi:hypothetical protein
MIDVRDGWTKFLLAGTSCEVCLARAVCRKRANTESTEVCSRSRVIRVGPDPEKGLGYGLQAYLY